MIEARSSSFHPISDRPSRPHHLHGLASRFASDRETEQLSAFAAAEAAINTLTDEGESTATTKRHTCGVARAEFGRKATRSPRSAGHPPRRQAWDGRIYRAVGVERRTPRLDMESFGNKARRPASHSVCANRCPPVEN